jgi:hypothetical protein
MQIEAVKSAKYYPQYKKHTPFVVRTIEQALPFLKAEFPLVDFSKIKVVVRPIPGRPTGSALETFGVTTVEIDCRMNTVWKILSVLAHEVTHVEQFQNKRLLWSRLVDAESKKTVYCNVWVEGGKEQLFKPSAGNTYVKYRNLPWEKEAFQRGGDFAEMYADRISK